MNEEFSAGDLVCLITETMSRNPMAVNRVDERGIECVWFSEPAGEYKTFIFNPLTLVMVERRKKP
jgi:uncharacterized protein YodC (DUF2158 family)